MTELKNQVQSLFLDALEIPQAEERAAFLDRQCGDDRELRQEVDELIDHAGRLGNFLDPGDGPSHVTAAHASPGAIGSQIGPYKLREQIGEGGMGVVYVAEQTEPVQRKVALKIIKPGMATKDVVARFEAERQALAMMDHPNISSVLDGGATENGQPFFVMELVKGAPITEYCDQQRLSTRDRLKLFLKVCRAVQHAHQKGIIHRDLKPSNVLVPEIDGEAVPKVIDFGVAKAVSQRLTDETIYTHFAQVVGTPMYMSPEQAGAGVLDIDTRSDVYSLGVLLYELLAGATPLDRESLKQSGLEKFRRRILEEDLRRPSDAVSTLQAAELSTVSQHRSVGAHKLAQSLRGDLDWIVMRALEKDRNLRYESASALAADINRHLNDRPIHAGPPSADYRFRKFVRRNRGRLVAGALVTVVIIGGLVLTTIAQFQQSHNRRRLEQYIRQSVAAARAMIDSGELSTAEQQTAELLGRLAYADQIAPRLKASVRQLAAEIERRKDQQRQFEQFEQLSRDAMDDILYDKRLDGYDVDGEKLAFQALGLYDILADGRWRDRLQTGFLSTSQQTCVRRTAYEILLVLAHQRIDDPASHSDDSLHESLLYLRIAADLHNPTRAFYWLRSKCHGLLSDQERAEHDSALFRETPAESPFDHYLPGHAAWFAGRREEAIHSYEAALRMRPDDFNALFFLAMRLSAIGRQAEAAQVYRACLALRPDHIPSLRNRAAEISEQEGDLQEALDLASKAIDLGDSSASVFGIRGDVYFAQGDFPRALLDYDEASRRAKSSDSRETLVNVYDHRAELFYRMGRVDTALGELNKAIGYIPRESSEEPYFHAFRNRARLLGEMQEYEKALADIDEAIRIADASSELSDVHVAQAHSTRARVLHSTQRNKEALLELEQARMLTPKQSTEALHEIHALRAASLLDLGRREEAIGELNEILGLTSEEPTKFWIWAHNSLAWELAANAESAFRDPPRALVLARKAVELDPDNGENWNTMGVAQYRANDYIASLESFDKSVELGVSDIGESYNALFLAMAHWQLGDQDQSRQWYAKAVVLMTEIASNKRQALATDDELVRLRAEAEELLDDASAAPQLKSGDRRPVDGEQERASRDDP